MIGIRVESLVDHEALDALLEAAFGQPDEARILRQLRDGGHLVLSLVAESHGELVGQAAFSNIAVTGSGGTLNCACLAPMAVRPDRQRKGIGSALIQRGLGMLMERRTPAVLVVGDPEYYGRFGFRPETASWLLCPYPAPYFQGLELTTGALAEMGPARACFPAPLMPPD